jgi:molybdopterin-guanine dinucleotide biosynthesis protein A
MGRLTFPAKFCSGFVLTGGRSSRMGQDKALMQVNGRSLVEIVAGNVVRGLDSVTLVGSRAKYAALGMPVIEDIHPGLGPLSGIHAALKHSRKPLCLVIGCDMPFLMPEFIEYMAQIAVVADADVTVAESSEHGYESLCAVYNRTALPAVEEAIAQRELKVATLYGNVKVRSLSAEECRPFNTHGILFSNVNTADDFTLARRRLEALAHRA